jgi:hypothetical protein
MNILNNSHRNFESKYSRHNNFFHDLNKLKKFLMLIVFSLCLLPVSAFSQPSSMSVVAAKAAVQGQLAAFAKDDAELAFLFAAPSIQAVFKTPQNFIDMVIRSYPVVYRPVRVIYMKSQSAGPDLLLPVQMTDIKGISWIANYTLQQQPDGKWLISGCVLSEDDSKKMNTVFI